MKKSTTAIHGGKEHKNQYRAVAQPIYRADTFYFDKMADHKYLYSGNVETYAYTRMANPSLTILEDRISALEGTEETIVAASGMGAIAAFLLTFLKAGDHIIANRTIYDGSLNLIKNTLAKFGVEVSIIDLNDTAKYKASLKKNTKIVYFETPCNPTLEILDVTEISNIAHKHNKNILVAVDNTFASPILQNPTALGADVSIHSLTKYMNGHSDVLGGSVSGSKKIIDQIRTVGIMYNTGAVMAPDNANLILRGIKTLAIRVKQASLNAMAIANYLHNNKLVKFVNYPGLKDFRGHEVASKEMSGYGGMLSFETTLNDSQVIKFIDSLKLFYRATSLGGVESLVELPGEVSHNDPKALKLLGFGKNLIRLSVGIEDVEDLIADLEQAFKKAKK